METIYNLASGPLYLLAVVGVFLSASLLAYGVFERGSKFMVSYKETFTESASANAADMFMFVDATRLFYINLIAIVVFPLLIWLLIGDLLTAAAVFILLAVLPGIMYARIRKKRLKKFEEQLPDGLMMLSGAMRAGASLNIALEGLVKEQPAPLGQEFELFMREQRLGTDFDKSLDHMEARLLGERGRSGSALENPIDGTAEDPLPEQREVVTACMGERLITLARLLREATS